MINRKSLDVLGKWAERRAKALRRLEKEQGEERSYDYESDWASKAAAYEEVVAAINNLKRTGNPEKGD